eukprot:CAMPEP_0172457338 /NCGR_PEP_ID=MMETSP1065-20121228/21612_1 /TAXON_ID=265537 /ORGANISM="Amphiprora paludosa, Strain CCMP125" /LENGTH=45 /DNA_ID= /DNA_START= /DNA_END= /DNA_ORIENTATION=
MESGGDDPPAAPAATPTITAHRQQKPRRCLHSTCRSNKDGVSFTT